MRFLTWLVTTAIALAVAAWVFDGIRFTGPIHGSEEIKHKLVPLLLVALILGLVSATVKPILKVVSIPFIILTLGLFTFIVNAFMLQLTEWLAGPLGLSFTIAHFFWDAVLGALIITIVSMVLGWVIPDHDD